ncbi:hypothetical protein WICMUC_001318 [Wickerhamomyces mucosus]|uniref:Major facilitator superfamily (MFS) profile domain-containing protein n=1 Tax=Wickerhamomyces mucosus TaxID=1378264 RepID=A0A9P8THL3_9ASCO|nr:hypothetical protein WICMUC_001318 [Wickerhamomyces mucosus]
MSKNESTPLLKGVRNDIVLDPSSGLEGFVAEEIEQDELLQDSSYTNYTEPSLTTDEDEKPFSPTRLRIILLSMYLGVFLASLDSTIITTLIGHIASEFNSLPKLPWIATSYLVSSATFQPIYGKISDIFGRRALLLFCNFFFTIGCFVCAIAPTVDYLILGRFISGIGGAGLTSLVTIATSDLIPLKSRGVYQGISNIAFGVGTAIGAIVGGLFADNESLGGWRGAFWIQIPLTLFSFGAIYLFFELPKNSLGYGTTDGVKEKLKSIDWFGSLSLITFLLLFLTGSSAGGKEIPFNSIGFKSLVIASIIALIIFIYIELKAKNPILPLQFLSIPTVLGVSIANFFFCMSAFTIFFTLPIYFTAVLNLNSQQIGNRFAPNFFSTIIGSLGGGLYIKYTGKYQRLLIISGVVGVLGTIRVAQVNPNYSVFEQYILLITPGMGISVIITATLIALISAVPHKHQAATTSISYLFRSCGSTLGVSIGSAIFNYKLNSELSSQVLKFKDSYDLEILEEIIYNAKHSSEYVFHGAPDFIRNTLINSYSQGTRLTFQVCVGWTILGFLGLFLIIENQLHATLKR